MYRKCDVIYNEVLTEGYLRLCFGIGPEGVKAQPGQFLMLKAWPGDAPFLMRPFSVNSINESAKTVEIIYRCVGKGTEMMRQLKAGDSIYALGPLGKGFPLKQQYKNIALIGRGIGAAPLRYLAECALRQGITPYVFLSACSNELFFDQRIYEGLGISVYTSSDPQELVTDKLSELLASMKIDAAYVCGSQRLMRELYRIGKQHGVEGYVSLEEHMACGMGACLGCICQVAAEPGALSEVRVCKDGPVFSIERVMANQH